MISELYCVLVSPCYFVMTNLTFNFIIDVLQLFEDNSITTTVAVPLL